MLKRQIDEFYAPESLSTYKNITNAYIQSYIYQIFKPCDALELKYQVEYVYTGVYCIIPLPVHFDVDDGI